MSEPLFIASYIAHVQREEFNHVKEIIERTEFAEIPALDEMGKIVVVIDAPSEGLLLDTAEDIRGIQGVLSFLPVYQHAE
ncbi:chaperone NapD [Sneathiella limimaris]|uniref:chaperone NapD n=1 Tax=Sneathiella limimaris TaxID=1964213 RepID=UPI00146BBD8C|nr:chaperone NapD [Sneathiella limimaris]